MDLSSNIMLSKMVCIYGLSNIPMECLKFGHGLWYCLCWCSLSFDISMRAEASTLRKVVMTGHEQPLMGRPREWVLHTNILWICHNLLVPIFSDPILHQINTSSDPKEQSRISTLPHLSGAEKARLRFTRCFTRSWHRRTLTLNNPKKNWIKITRNQSKKKRLGVYIVLPIGCDGNFQFLVGKDIQESEQVFSWTTNSLSKLILLGPSQPLIFTDQKDPDSKIGFSVIQNRTNSNLNLFFYLNNPSGDRENIYIYIYVIPKNWKSGDRLAESVVFYTEQPIWRSIQQPISRSRLNFLASAPESARVPTFMTSPWPGGANSATDLRNGPYLKALPCPGTPEIPIRPFFSNGWFLEVWRISSSIFPTCTDWFGSSSNWLKQPFLTCLFLMGSRVVPFVLVCDDFYYQPGMCEHVWKWSWNRCKGLLGLVFEIQSSTNHLNLRKKIRWRLFTIPNWLEKNPKKKSSQGFSTAQKSQQFAFKRKDAFPFSRVPS